MLKNLRSFLILGAFGASMCTVATEALSIAAHNRFPQYKCYNVNAGGSKIGSPDGNGGVCNDVSIGGMRILPDGAGLIFPDKVTPISKITQTLGCQTDTGGIRVKAGTMESLKLMFGMYISGQLVDLRIGVEGGICT